MIGRERRGESDGHMKAMGGAIDDKESTLISVPTPAGRFRITTKGISLLVALITFIVLLNVPVIDEEEPNRCFAILGFCTVLWATEAIPLFVTSMMVPLLVVVLRVVRTEHDGRLGTHAATALVSAHSGCHSRFPDGHVLCTVTSSRSCSRRLSCF